MENSIADEAARYKIWAANIGALLDAKSANSLDSRLTESSRMRQNVTSCLERLRDAVTRASEIVAQIKPNRTVDLLSKNEIAKLTAKLVNGDGLERAKDGTTELAELFFNIRSCITNLFALSALIRQDRPRGREQRQGHARTPNDAGPDITNVKDKFPKLRQRPWLAERIGKRIAQQRDYIRYRQVHRQKLAKRKTTDPVTQDGGSGIISTKATTKATTFVEQLAVTGEASELAGETFTEGSIHTEATSFATTALADDGPGRSIPSLTVMWLDGVYLGYDKHIECPYCRVMFIMISRPTVALLKTVHQNHFRHLMNGSNTSWHAIDGNGSAFGHPQTVSAGQIKVMVEACERAITHFDDTACPLCNDWKPASTTDNNSSKFRSHLAKHLQELAREALPLAIDGLEIRDDEEASREIQEGESDVESISTSNSNSSHGAPNLAYMAPYGKFFKAEEHWRACSVCGKILAATECDDCNNPPDPEVWVYAASRDIKDPISFEADSKQRSMLNLKIAGEVRRTSWRNSFITGFPSRREEGMEHDPFMDAYLVSEEGRPSFQPSEPENVRETVPVIKFTDILDRTFHFPLSLCLDYKIMVDMVKMAFLYEKFAQMVIAGQFELMNSEGVAISPVIWSRVVVQGSVVRMRLLENPASSKTGYLDTAEESDRLQRQPPLDVQVRDETAIDIDTKQGPEAETEETESVEGSAEQSLDPGLNFDNQGRIFIFWTTSIQRDSLPLKPLLSPEVKAKDRVHSQAYMHRIMYRSDGNKDTSHMLSKSQNLLVDDNGIQGVTFDQIDMFTLTRLMFPLGTGAGEHGRQHPEHPVLWA
ncbi:hypothetical protein CcaCcLH18_12322 [Colletotrichum camelliae]|nr:hypothetical protein CcaCcLH18_12322 [Colletotrichum camelliae]